MSIPFSTLPNASAGQTDAGPLSWVMGEIRDALGRSGLALQEAVAQDAESRSTSLYHAKTHLHQAHGALQMVDLDGVTVVTEAIEQLLERLAAAQIALAQSHADIVADAYQALLEYLEHLLSGAQQQAVRLYPYHKAVLEALGAPRIHPADLFFPQLAEPVGLSAIDAGRAPQAFSPASYASMRQRFEMALLPFLKSSDPALEAGGAAAMCAVIAEIEQAQTEPQAHRFWWVMHGFADAVCRAQIPRGRFVKQLFALLNLQIRRLAQGSHGISESLLRDALFFIAQIEQPSAVASAIRAAHRIEAPIPADYELRRYGQIDVEALRAAKQGLAQAKNMWSRIAGGDVGCAESFEREMKTLAAASEKLNSLSLAKLLRELNGIARHAAHSSPEHDLCLEMATGLLFVEHALDNISHLGDDFSGRADALSGRLISIVAGEAPLASGQWLDELSEQAQQKQTLSVLATEMQANLRQVEKSLDEYFFNPSKKELLSNLEPALHQIAGALAILDQNDAMCAVEHTQAVVRGFAASLPDAPDDRQAYQDVAQNVGALGFFLEMLAANPQAARSRFIFNPQQGIFHANLFEKSGPAAAGTTTAHSVALPADVGSATQEDDLAPPTAQAGIADGAAVAALETVTEAAPGDDEVDAELLEIFISEAQEVLACVSQTLPQSRQDSHNQEHLATLRRSFHTLKGSGRMVGLSVFGNAAWSIEQVMNLWLSEERNASAELYALLELAVQEMQAWVAEIALDGQSGRAADALIAAAERVKIGQAPELPAAAMPPVMPEAADAEQMSGLDFDFDPDLKLDLDLDLEPSPEVPPPAERSEQAETTSLMSPAPDAPEPTPTSSVIVFPAIAAMPARPDDTVKRIGDVDVSVPLHNIFLAETDEIVRLLSNDFAEWRHEGQRAVSPEAINAAHSLCGSSATVGFKGLHDLARALEKLLQHLARQPAILETEEFDAIEQCMTHCKSMLQTFALGEMPPLPLAQIRLLESLHRMLRQRRGPADSLVEEEAAPPAAPATLPEQLQALVPANTQPGALNSYASGAAALLINDALDVDLLPVFIEEGHDLLSEIGRLLRAWQQKPADSGLPQALLRVLHTVKGSARMAGAMVLGQHAHDIETRIGQLMQGGAPAPLALDELLASHDHSLSLFEQLQHPAPAAATAVAEMPAADAVATAQAAAAPMLSPATLQVPLVRVRAEIIDRLVNHAGEVSISRSRLENEVGTLRSSLSELTENVSRLRSQLREIEMQAESQIMSLMPQSGDREFDPLEFDRFTRLQELTRMMAESVNDVATVQQSLTRTVEEASTDLSNQARLTRDLQQDLMRVRMVPFASVSERLYQVARQAAKDVGKRVNLEISGTAVEVDRSVLEKMAAPFEHLLRNAIAHGIETREQRRALGKSDTGELLVQVQQEGNEVVIRFSDDGQGLDLARIRAKAIKVGLLGIDSAISDADTMDLIFQPGLSTATEITELAGRGIGMDVVHEEVSALGGRVAISSNAGQGACFTIHLPLTLAVTQVVLLEAGGKTYAVPSALVEQVQQLKSQALANAYNQAGIVWQDGRVELHNLSVLLADDAAVPPVQQYSQYSPLIILRSGSDRVAIHVDKVLGNREVVVKNIGPQLARMVGIAGATVLGSGEIVLILNPVALALHAARADQRAQRLTRSDAPDDLGAVAELSDPQIGQTHQPVSGLRTQRIVMVVDDSLTVRRVTQRLLAREGYQVALAKDGVDALQQLQTITPDVMLVDIEMPRMDGFDLTRNVRSDERTRSIPIIMITSRTADKHRNYAMELGADAYFGKPFQEDVLLQAIATHIAPASPAG
ncbi:MAG: Hpt domain-containing protein [Oxalobacteraceae bacterium]|nr:Hpt domain-containing protein [Oxalobacteraceae bacterium]